jgi:hypothetical protein
MGANEIKDITKIYKKINLTQPASGVKAVNDILLDLLNTISVKVIITSPLPAKD